MTGGAGFIGSHLCEKLLAQGKRVFALDNLSTGSLDNIRHLLGHKNFVFKKGSVLNKFLVRGMAMEADEIYHLAAAVGVQTVMDKPLDSLILNTRGTEIVLDAAEKRKIPIMLVSTSEIYGKSTKLPFHEEDDRVYGSAYNYRWGYAFSKGVDEFLGLAYFRERGVPVRIVRLFNIIGPRQTGEYGMVVPRFIRQALVGKPITVYGTGRQTRSFADVDDATDALIKVMSHPKSMGEIYNLGSDEEISINDLAQNILRLTGSSSKILHIRHDKVYGKGFEDMQRRRPDIFKIKKLIGYKPKYTLEESIKKIIKHESK
ncbi:MAG: GDP-mannose 4,6-dehydratase [Candidatus Colwellbacteria bacterium]|nr:GDP-mannose 4,6-dehydratase [Candidatus Colwellbacteria bacterium]